MLSVNPNQPVTHPPQSPPAKPAGSAPASGNIPAQSPPADALCLQIETGPLQPNLAFVDPPASTWKIRGAFSHSVTKYFDTDMQLKSSRLDVKIKDFSMLERGSRDFYNPTNWEQPMDALRWLDEPTNTFAVVLEKDKDEIYLSAFHPKFLFDHQQVKPIQGTVDGVVVNHVDYVSKPFDGYDQVPGELEMSRFENTHLQMEYEVGYGRKIPLCEHPKLGRLVYTPGLSAGVMTGGTYSSMVREGEWWEHDGVKDRYRVQGAGGSVRNKLSWESPNGKVAVFGENKTSLYHLEHGFMDGKATYNLAYTSTAVGVSIGLYSKKK